MNTSTLSNSIVMTVSEDQDEHHPRSTRSMMMIDSSSGSEGSSDAPSTPPSASKGLLSSSSAHGPPSCRRYERPINRRLFLQEAQERLSLPDLFAPGRTTRAPTRRTRTPRMHIPRPSNSRSSSSRSLLSNSLHSAGSFGGSSRNLAAGIQPRAAQWGEYFENQGHSMSQRSVFGNNPAIL